MRGGEVVGKHRIPRPAEPPATRRGRRPREHGHPPRRSTTPGPPGWRWSRDGEPFNVEETALLRGMARALAQTVRTLELVGSLRSRQALLERLAQIQRSIVQPHRSGRR